MYQITYKKQNGEVFNRIRNTLPGYIGDETSMGWIILDIKYSFKNNYYSFAEYKQLMNKYRKFNKISRSVNRLFKKYGTTIALFIVVPLYLIEII